MGFDVCPIVYNCFVKVCYLAFGFSLCTFGQATDPPLNQELRMPFFVLF